MAPWGLRSTAAAGVLLLAGAGFSPAAGSDPAQEGAFATPFAEPTIEGHETEDPCIEHSGHHGEEEPHLECKPAAGSMAVLTDGRIVYWNALEGTENIKTATAAEFGEVSINDQTRVLDLRGPSWSEPQPADGGANPDGAEPDELIPGSATRETYNDGALFCADLIQLADGRILAAGGTKYYTELGAAELEGLANTRVFDPATDSWSQAAAMNFARWYPTMVTLGSGDVFIASGVRKLIKPVYPDAPSESGRNVIQTETYDVDNDRWGYNGQSADRSLPLYPRLHLLPNGHIYYNAAGQVFNPNGFAWDELTWNMAASYDPVSKDWTDLGIPGIGGLTPGFRGSTFSLMLPLRPDDEGRYTSAEFLTAGGVVGTSPGGYFAVPTSSITTVDTEQENAIETRSTGMLTEPRWYGTGVLLPTGEVAVFSGSNRDEVVGPGTGEPVAHVEIFDPETETWRSGATATQMRAYHNTATLLPDGRVLVGGHAPIPTLYGAHQTLPGFSPNEGRDPTFEIYSPPYLFRGPRPEIVRADTSLAFGERTSIVTNVDASRISRVVLVRNPSVTHLVDGDQRTVELRVAARNGRTLLVDPPPNGNVAPPGPYMLFVIEEGSEGPVPSEAAQVFLTRG